MEKFSASKVALMLAIICFYIFMFGIMGFTSEPESVAVTTSVLSTTPPPPVTTAKTTVLTQSYFKPGYADYIVTQALKTDAAVIDNEASTVRITTKADTVPVISEPIEDITTPAATTEASTTPATTTSKTTTTTKLPETTTKAVTTTETSTETTTVTTTEATTETTTITTPETTTQKEEIIPPPIGDEYMTISVNGSVMSGMAFDIVCMMVNCEMGSGFNKEALKAQAVASYTYVKYFNTRGSAPSVVIKENPGEIIKSAVAEVIGQAVYYEDSYIQAVYHASSAGYTASSKNVWGTDLPYLRSIECELDALYDPNYGYDTNFSSAEIKNIVYNKTGIELEGNPSEWFKFFTRADGGKLDTVYVGDMLIGGYSSYNSGGSSVKITGRVFREKIMEYKIRSASFKIKYDVDTDKFTITTYGYGHGVGMSQNGANLYAKQYDYDYKQILLHYYRNCEVK